MSRRGKSFLVGMIALFSVAAVATLWYANGFRGPSISDAPAVSSPAASAAKPPGVSALATGSGKGLATSDEGVPGAGAADLDAADLFSRLRTEPPARDLADLALRMGRTSALRPAATPGRPAERAIGDGETFWLHDINSEQYFTLTAQLEASLPNAQVWVQGGQTFDGPALERGAQGFSDEVYPKVRAVFGEEWSPGIDGDPRLHILHHEPIAGIAGYFYSADEYSAEVEPHSNQREMFYINLSATTPGSYDYLALLAHELQHMIHWNHDRDESAWVNEGLSELAARVAGYPVQSGNAFLLGASDTALFEWDHEPGANAAHYAAAYTFFAYLRQRYGDAVIRAIVEAPGNGAAGIEAALAAVGAPQTFEQVFEDWVVANLVHAPGTGETGRRYGYGDLPIAYAEAQPLPEGELASTVNPYGTDYHDVTARVQDGRLRLGFAGDATTGLLEAVPARAGRLWWSGRGDNTDARLTRTFDLTGVDRAALDFRAWYDLEENWDYAYFQASTDGGRTWERIPTSRTTDASPNGNNFGAGLTGSSGTWVGETLDLTPYAGRPVTLRLEVVTDDAVNMSGLAIDDLRLDAVGFADDAETDAGWQAEGWLRLDPALPQRWGLVAIIDSPSAGLKVQPIEVGPDGSADIDLAGIPPDAKVTLAVSALTPATRNVAGYRIMP